jgi:outer membrane protein TolC
MGCRPGTYLELHRYGRRACRLGIVLLLIVALLPAGVLYGQEEMQQDAVGQEIELPSAGDAPLAMGERVLQLTLEDAIQLALQNSLAIERERFGPLIALTDIDRAKVEFDPKVGAEVNVSETQNLRTSQSPIFVPILDSRSTLSAYLRHIIVTGGNYELRFVTARSDQSPDNAGFGQRIHNPLFENSLELTFTHPLLKNFGISVNKAPIRQAEIREQIAEQNVVQTILDTVFAVHRGYWELVFRIQDLAAKRESQQLAEDFLAENTVRVELGTLAPIELVQAETQVKTRQGDVIVAEAAVRDADDQLKAVLNIPESMGSWGVRLQPTDIPSIAPVSTAAVEEQVDIALQQRPDYLSSQLDIRIREISRDEARNQSLPRLDVIGTGRLNANEGDLGDTFSALPDGDGYQWAVGLQMEITLGSRAKRVLIDKRQLELRQARIGQRQLVLTIGQQVRQAVRSIQTNIQRVEVTRSATMLARTQLEAEQEKFRLGLSTSFNVLEFQEDLTNALSNETRALSDYNVALAQLDQLTGMMQYHDVR